MKIIYVDDERAAHTNFYYDLKDRTEVDTLEFFFTAQQALEYARMNPVDCAFLDVDLADGECGLSLAEELKKIHPRIELGFVTAHDHYARSTYRVGGRVYLTKPYMPEELDEALSVLHKLVKAHQGEYALAQRPQSNVEMKTFGNFDLIVRRQPVAFKNSKAKELLAFLVHQHGGTVNNAQIFLALWEDKEYTAVTSTYVRRTARALKAELEEIGLADLLINKRNCYSVDTTRFMCDCYRLIDGDKDAIRMYQGEYMRQYAWGEDTIPLLDQKAIPSNA